MAKVSLHNEHVVIKVVKSQARFTRIKNAQGADKGVGNFFLLLFVTAQEKDVYIPLSIASGKKTTGFMYQIEGTSMGSIGTASIDAGGDGTTKVTLGTLHYVRIPKGVTAEFRLQFKIEGKVGKEYAVNLRELNYKLDPTDARYKKLASEVRTRTLEFR